MSLKTLPQIGAVLADVPINDPVALTETVIPVAAPVAMAQCRFAPKIRDGVIFQKPQKILPG